MTEFKGELRWAVNGLYIGDELFLEVPFKFNPAIDEIIRRWNLVEAMLKWFNDFIRNTGLKPACRSCELLDMIGEFSGLPTKTEPPSAEKNPAPAPPDYLKKVRKFLEELPHNLSVLTHHVDESYRRDIDHVANRINESAKALLDDLSATAEVNPDHPDYLPAVRKFLENIFNYHDSQLHVPAGNLLDLLPPKPMTVGDVSRGDCFYNETRTPENKFIKTDTLRAELKKTEHGCVNLSDGRHHWFGQATPVIPVEADND